MTIDKKGLALSSSKGFIAITSAIIMSLIMTTIVLAANVSGFFNRYELLDTYSKEVSRSLAEACVQVAIRKLATDPTYGINPTIPPAETVSIGTDSCEIRAIETPVVTDRIIKTKATVNRTVTNLQVRIVFLTNTVLSWEEIETL